MYCRRPVGGAIEMTAVSDWVELREADQGLALRGDWRLQHASPIAARLATLCQPAATIDARGIESLDAAGAFLLLRLARQADVSVSDIAIREDHGRLLQAVAAAMTEEEAEPAATLAWWARVPAHLGLGLIQAWHHSGRLIGFLGLSLQTLAATVFRPRQWRITATVHHMQATGLDALPLVSLLSFLVGAVVAFLGATVLRDFGAELFVVDLTTFAFLREFGVLLTAILLAGRTASAFTAQIGTMKSREEIDAIRTLGLDPIVLLVLPRLIALVIMLPLLSVVATLSGLLGGLAVATFSLGMPFEMYINRVYETATLSHYLTGLSKAPLFAVVIALVGCLEGFKVTGTAQSVGERTTSAVVQSISLVIVINALAAVFFMEMGW